MIDSAIALGAGMRPILNAPPHVYASTGYRRAAHRRTDEAWIRERLADPATLILPMAKLRVVAQTADPAPRLRRFTAAELALPDPDSAVFLGMLDDSAVFAVDWPDETTHEFVDLRSIGPALPGHEAGLGATARALLHWHARHRFCGICGGPTRPVQAGHARHCTACGDEVFPRTDPAMIVLVTHGDDALLGRASRFPPGMYSTLAGFVEPGESIEDTVRREVEEEAGVEVDDVIYRSSQPWPFPQSLMIGFRATARSREIRIDRDELEDAAWFPREVLRDPERCPIRLPGPDSIARFLIEEWLAEAP